MNFFFDYIFYRIAQLRFKRDGEKAGFAVTVISMLQTMLIEFLIQPTFMFFFTRNTLAEHARQSGLLAGAIFIGLLFLNYRSYSGKYPKYDMLWRDEKKRTRVVKGVLVALCFIIPVVIIVLTNDELHHG